MLFALKEPELAYRALPLLCAILDEPCRPFGTGNIPRWRYHFSHSWFSCSHSERIISAIADRDREYRNAARSSDDGKQSISALNGLIGFHKSGPVYLNAEILTTDHLLSGQGLYGKIHLPRRVA